MNGKTLDYVNIGLILAACAIAFAAPFELFLFSFAVLGPLHYLTEIHWLHRRNYFTSGKHDYLVLVILCFPLLVNYVFPVFRGYNHLVFVAFFSALGMVVLQRTRHKVCLVAVLLATSLMLGSWKPYVILFAVFLPTIGHVFFFTGAFMLFGALRSKSRVGVASVVLLFLCAPLCLGVRASETGYELSPYVQQSFLASGFHDLNRKLIKLVYWQTPSRELIFASDIGMRIMRFVAFAYTYHYLNWFSKTSIIGWHRISKTGLGVILAIWLLSVGLYAYDYGVGLTALFFLSTLHVFLEFPLNFHSFIGIGKEARLVLQPRGVVPMAGTSS